MTALEKLVDSHLHAYADPDGKRRLESIRQTWNPQGRLADPPFSVSGHEAIDEVAAKVVAQFPGHRFVRTSAIDSHNDFARYAWKLQDAQGHVALEGIDFVTFDGNGRILQVVGFFGTQMVPA